MNVRLILLACRVLLGVVFLLACVHKILFPEAFALALFRYQLLPASLINLTAIVLPWIECVAAFAIIFSSRFKDGAAALMLVMLLVFTTAILFNIARGLDVACGCFSSAAGAADGAAWENVIRNAGYLFLAAIVLWEERIVSRLQPRRR